MSSKVINPKNFHYTVQKMRQFFLNKGFVEVHPQSAVSILAACEDPKNISKYNFNGIDWPLPQTGQMWLEHCMLQNPDLKGLFCVSTSYRNEPNPIPGRHERIFPLFEFEQKGDLADLLEMERDLCMHMGFGEEYDNKKENLPEESYLDMCKKYNVDSIEAKEEGMMAKDFGNVLMLKEFPMYTSPFWNMKMDGDISRKVDVILGGHETIGSAERSTDVDCMRDMFMNISEGQYKDILFAKFGKERVLRELDQFLSYDFFPRSGGGIGVTRMMSALEKIGKIQQGDNVELFKEVCEKTSENKEKTLNL